MKIVVNLSDLIWLVITGIGLLLAGILFLYAYIYEKINKRRKNKKKEKENKDDI